MSPNNCKSCVHKVLPPNNAHCWRFKSEPQIRCRQFHANLLPDPVPLRRTILERSR